MTHPMMIWYAVVAAVLLFFKVEFIRYVASRHKNSRQTHHAFISVTSERELFFVPGDPDPHEMYQDDLEDM